MSDFTITAALAIFAATYVIVALGKIPVYRIDRAGAALLGQGGVKIVGIKTCLGNEQFAQQFMFAEVHHFSSLSQSFIVKKRAWG